MHLGLVYRALNTSIEIIVASLLLPEDLLVFTFRDCKKYEVNLHNGDQNGTHNKLVSFGF